MEALAKKVKRHPQVIISLTNHEKFFHLQISSGENSLVFLSPAYFVFFSLSSCTSKPLRGVNKLSEPLQLKQVPVWIQLVKMIRGGMQGVIITI